MSERAQGRNLVAEIEAHLTPRPPMRFEPRTSELVGITEDGVDIVCDFLAHGNEILTLHNGEWGVWVPDETP